MMELNDKQRIFIENKLNALSSSKFRSSFKLSKRMNEYIINNDYDVIEKHAFDLIRKRLAPKDILNDGRQTPMKGHPVFIAQHATGTCCRGCLLKWHKISKDKDLSEKEITFIVALIMEWIKKQEV